MRILLLTTHLNIGGISTYVVSLAKALKAKGNEVYVVSSGGVLVPKLTKEGVSHIKIDLLTKSFLHPKVFKGIFEIHRLVKTLDIDIIHAQTRITQVIGFFVSKISKAKFVSTCHGFFRKNPGRAIFPAWGEKVIAISEAVKDHLKKDFNVDESRIALIYNGIDIKKFLRVAITEDEKKEFKNKFGIKEGSKVIGTISRFTPDKGHDVLLYAFKEILKEAPDIVLVFVGDGKEKSRIIDFMQSFNLSDNVVFIKPQINTVNVLSIMDIFMFTPTRKEGFGLVLLEALAMGKPIVATNVGGVSTVIKDGVNGFLVGPMKPELLIKPVLKLLKDEELYKNMARAGKETVVQKFSVDGMADKTEDIYNEVKGIVDGKKK
ncbi:MAG: glycosyltransferase family 4 protein [Candidatus Omnitrophota bacterium]